MDTEIYLSKCFGGFFFKCIQIKITGLRSIVLPTRIIFLWQSVYWFIPAQVSQILFDSVYDLMWNIRHIGHSLYLRKDSWTFLLMLVCFRRYQCGSFQMCPNADSLCCYRHFLLTLQFYLIFKQWYWLKHLWRSI